MRKRLRERLAREDVSLVRSMARESWIQSGGDVDAAREDVKNKLRNGYGSIIGSILVGLAIKLAFELIMHWWNSSKEVPAVDFVEGEPGFGRDWS